MIMIYDWKTNKKNKCIFSVLKIIKLKRRIVTLDKQCLSLSTIFIFAFGKDIHHLDVLVYQVFKPFQLWCLYYMLRQILIYSMYIMPLPIVGRRRYFLSRWKEKYSPHILN